MPVVRPTTLKLQNIPTGAFHTLDQIVTLLSRNLVLFILDALFRLLNNRKIPLIFVLTA